MAAALAAVTERFGGDYATLADAVEDITCFEDCYEGSAAAFELGWHNEKYLTCTDELLAILAPFAEEGSYVRFHGEDGSLFGFRVLAGRLREESGEYRWALDAEHPPTSAAPA